MFNFKSTVIPKNVVIVGCGSVGSRLVPILAQFIKTQEWIINPQITLIDGSEVEAEDIPRQNFITQDVGKNKAQVLAERYSAAYEMDIRYLPKYLTSHRKEDILAASSFFTQTPFRKVNTWPYITTLGVGRVYKGEEPLLNTDSIPLVILCTDNLAGKKEILDQLTLTKNVYKEMLVVDCETSSDNGRVRLFNIDYKPRWHPGQKWPERSSQVYSIGRIPYPGNYYIREDSYHGDGKPSIAVSVQVTGFVMNIINNLTYSLPFTFRGLEVGPEGLSVETLSSDWANTILRGSHPDYCTYRTKAWGDHLWEVKNFEESWEYTRDFSAYEKVRLWRNYNLNLMHDHFPNVDTEKFAYILRCIAMKGSFANNAHLRVYTCAAVIELIQNHSEILRIKEETVWDSRLAISNAIDEIYKGILRAIGFGSAMQVVTNVRDVLKVGKYSYTSDDGYEEDMPVEEGSGASICNAGDILNARRYYRDVDRPVFEAMGLV